VNSTRHFSCLEIAGAGGIWSCIPYFSDRLVSEGAWRSSLCCHHVTLTVHVKSEAANDIEPKFLRTCNDGSSLCCDKELAWSFMTHSSDIKKLGR
jgi:hypothetical protein